MVVAVTVQEATGGEAQNLQQTVEEAQNNLAGVTAGAPEEARWPKWCWKATSRRARNNV